MGPEFFETELFQFHLRGNLNVYKGMCLCILGHQSYWDVVTSSRPVNKLKKKKEKYLSEVFQTLQCASP